MGDNNEVTIPDERPDLGQRIMESLTNFTLSRVDKFLDSLPPERRDPTINTLTKITDFVDKFRMPITVAAGIGAGAATRALGGNIIETVAAGTASVLATHGVIDIARSLHEHLGDLSTTERN